MFSIFYLEQEEGKLQYCSLLTLVEFIEPYYLLDYFEFFCNGYENLICFSYNNLEKKCQIYMVGYLNPVKSGAGIIYYFDFITPYGYTGPVFSSNVEDSDIYEFWNCVDKWYKENNVISEFIRFNLSNNHLNYSGEVFPTMLNIKGKIIDEVSQWNLFDRKVRKNVNKANRENLTSKVFYLDIKENEIEEFFDIYSETMIRTNASSNFFYNIEIFKKFIFNNKENCALITIYLEDIPISTELVLISNENVYSFLGGTDANYFDKRPNDLLKVELINWARKQGKSYYVLGGGYGSDDGIFKYKKSFFPNDAVTFYTGRKIINKDIYQKLINETNIVRVAGSLPELESNDTSFFPLYKKTN